MKTIHVTAFAGAVGLLLVACQKNELSSAQDPAAAAQDLLAEDRGPLTPGFVYTNQASGNSVLRYTRQPNGRLDPNGSYPTSGNGSGGGLGSQGALVLSSDGKWLFAVNAGSDNVTVLRVQSSGPRAVCIANSGGVRPISLTQHGSLLYVLNAGSVTSAANITGFHIEANGGLTLIANSARALSTALPMPAQISFNQDGTALVAEKATNTISSFAVDASGMPGALHTTPSAGQTPFGFSLGQNGQFFVTEAFGGAAGLSTVSTYAVDANANVTLVDGLNALGQSAACWAVTTNNGKTVLTTNTASGNMSSLSVDAFGDLSLLQGIAGDAGAGSGPIDAYLSKNSKYLYVLETNTHAISAYALGTNGTLTQVDEELGLPVGTVGLAAK
jgi:6-phosphogluconolactonase